MLFVCRLKEGYLPMGALYVLGYEIENMCIGDAGQDASALNHPSGRLQHMGQLSLMGPMGS